MNFESYSTQFAAKAESYGYSEEIILRCLNYAKPIIENNLPVIYNASHLASLVGYRETYLSRAIVFTSFFYRQFNITKTNGSKRLLSEPLPSLKEIQDWILQNILYKIPCSKFAKAYIPGQTLKQNLVFHRDQPAVLNMDIKNFFGNIRRFQIERMFRHQGYSFFVANLLSKLCCYNEVLPQGAPTSPYLSNLIMRDFDENVAKYCSTHKIRFTRYADDLSFSGDFSAPELINLVKQQLRPLYLELNDSKTRLMTRDQRQIVSGVVVNKKLQVSKVKRDTIRQAIHYIRRYGLNDHLNKTGIKNSNYLHHLLGKIRYVLFINADDKEFIQYQSDILRLIEEHNQLKKNTSK